MTSLMNKSNRNQSLYGSGDQSLISLAKAARQVIPDNLGNSGTAERALPALSAIEAIGSGEPVKAGVKLAAGKLGLDAAGKAMRNQGILGKYIRSGIPGVRAAVPAIDATAPTVGYGTAETERGQDADPIARASGGKVHKPTVDELVDRLVQRWKSAKKQTDATTKSLLKVPDATIVKALDIAGRAI
jgi:hypothetical protein